MIHSSHQQPTTPSSNELQEQTLSERLVENSTTEHFVRRLKGVCSHPHQDRSGISPFPMTSTPDEIGFRESDAQPKSSNYTYIPLESDNLRPKVLVKLPPHSYALYLLGQFESFMGSDYHWYQKKRFRAQVDAIYDPSQSQQIERTWLCCFSVVLALGESYNDTVAPSFLIDTRTGYSTDNAAPTDLDPLIPGIEFFKQALLLLRPSYEEPTIDQVEALNLITFYCYSLNRRKTAYAYAGMALRLAELLGLSKPQTHLSPLEQEHRKRIWWTTICMDVMTCIELSLTPSHASHEDGINLPDSSHLSAADAEQFSDPQYLTAQIKLCRIKFRIIRTVSELRFGDTAEAQALIEPCLQVLNNWRLELSPTLKFTEEGGFSDETLAFTPMRTVASLMLRFNQCIILLIRPLLLKQLHDIMHEQDVLMPRNDFAGANTQCLQAAADSTAVQFALSKCHKIAKFGFWDSLHIFSSLTVHVISERLIEKRPTAFATGRPNIPYGPVRGLLGEMARVGNAASKDHEKMIRDIEELFTETPSNPVLTERIEDLVDWPEYMDTGNMSFEFDETFPSFGWS
ncbi:fungal specific transcription factor domain-containing protein [Aspergillus melleus]|uniref:fungal specific transcription factor domain-containing protein n=1 Tax=Aspergillus melleus TaxID=138277 RepID=UPI001E8D2C58|nr:uncharacterized protein LDX57_012125 [Aspergillus melleus]KAH8434480.1 hypothetical protein LDX57_012125 [Aspergillus melleus]